MAAPRANRHARAVKPAETSGGPFAAILGESAAAAAIRSFGARAASVDASVLLTGESGTGKGVLARAIHVASSRRRGPFVAVNCAGIPETLFESEFFGHTRGAFTGAQQAHRGLFEQANGGTLFLDEIGELPLPLQAKLLTALEDREFRRVGGEQPVRVDCRVIAATGVDLERAVENRRFRRDLYHRLLVLSFRLPALRERERDAELLAHAALASACGRYDRYIRGFSPAALGLIRTHPWPGNVRQLYHGVEAAVLAATGSVIELRDFPDAVLGRSAAPPDDERAALLEALRRARGNRTHAARALGIARNTLRARLRACGITQRDIDEAIADLTT
jgi:two-component system response regulator HydG